MRVKSVRSFLAAVCGCLTFAIPSLLYAAPCVEERVDDAEWVVVDTRITANATHLRQEFICNLLEDGQIRGTRGASTTLGPNPGVDAGFEIDLARATPSDMGDVFSEPLPSDVNLLELLKDQIKTRVRQKYDDAERNIRYERKQRGLGGGGIRGQIEITGEVMTEASPDFVMVPITNFDPLPFSGDFYIPFFWEDIGDGDWLSIFLDDQLIWETSNDSYRQNELYFAGVDSRLFTGTHNLLTFVLNSQGAANASVILAEDYRYLDNPVEVPEPSPFYLLLLGLLLLKIRRHYCRNTGDQVNARRV